MAKNRARARERVKQMNNNVCVMCVIENVLKRGLVSSRHIHGHCSGEWPTRNWFTWWINKMCNGCADVDVDDDKSIFRSRILYGENAMQKFKHSIFGASASTLANAHCE